MPSTRLPPDASVHASDAGAAHAGAPDGFPGGTRVVVAEDDPASCKLVCLLLQKLGLEVHPAQDGRRALELVKELAPHLVLMDLHMPLMSGPEAVRALRADSQAPQPLVVMLSANIFADRDAHDLSALGVAEFLTKPVDRVQLHAMLSRLLPRG
jgi:CheY-like chemotaxis protein